MKFLKKLWNAFFILFTVLTMLILIGAFVPGVSSKMAELVRAVAGEEDASIHSATDRSASADRDLGKNEISVADTDDHNVADEGAFESAESNIGVTPIDFSDEDDGISLVGEMTVPDEVSDKSDFQPIEEKVEQVDHPETMTLAPVGETGDGYSFDGLFYPYYEMLDSEGQHLYRQIYANAMALNPEFAPVEAVNSKEMHSIFVAVFNDHPELFFMDTTYACLCKKDGEVVQISLEFNDLASDIEQTRGAFESAAEEIAQSAAEFESDYAKEKSIHDALIKKNEYVKGAPYNQSAYSALVNGRTVCAGYTRAFQYVCQKLGIPCYCCTGYAKEDHAWNIIKLDDGFYNVDVTWDDTGDGGYTYFNRTDADFSGDHTRQELSVKLPPCDATGYRDLEPKPTPKDNRRSVRDLGIDESLLIGSIPEYYDDCRNKILAAGLGTYSFSCVVCGKDTFESVRNAYTSKEYESGYLMPAMEILGATECSMKLVMEELKDGNYLITHEITLN